MCWWRYCWDSTAVWRWGRPSVLSRHLSILREKAIDYIGELLFASSGVRHTHVTHNTFAVDHNRCRILVNTVECRDLPLRVESFVLYTRCFDNEPRIDRLVVLVEPEDRNRLALVVLEQ